MPRLPLLAAAGYLAATAAYAAPPPDGAKPLSEIIAGIEASQDVAWIDEVDWDDRGYWKIEFYTPAGAEVEIRVDPVSGEIRR
ncbi:MAG: PepSY domain-containing protein [Gemmobacter sp.]